MWHAHINTRRNASFRSHACGARGVDRAGFLAVVAFRLLYWNVPPVHLFDEVSGIPRGQTFTVDFWRVVIFIYCFGCIRRHCWSLSFMGNSSDLREIGSHTLQCTALAGQSPNSSYRRLEIYKFCSLFPCSALAQHKIHSPCVFLFVSCVEGFATGLGPAYFITFSRSILDRHAQSMRTAPNIFNIYLYRK